VASTMTLRRDAFPASPVNARLSWALRLALLLQCSPVSSIVFDRKIKRDSVSLGQPHWNLGFQRQIIPKRRNDDLLLQRIVNQGD
jgi:hypothetical protein